MILDEEYAQKFVDRIMENIGYNVNIMNSQGIIIASGSKERIGDYHKIALDVIKHNRMIIVKKDCHDSVKKGINMPFYNKNELVGVIGITGDPVKLQESASMVKMTVEIMLEQVYLKEKMYVNENQKNFYVSMLLNSNFENNYNEIEKWSKRLGYTIELPRRVCLVSLKEFMKSEKDFVGKMNIKNKIIQKIKSSRHSHLEDIVAEKGLDKIIICKYVKALENQTSRSQFEVYFDDINELLSKEYGLTLLVGVGSFHQEGVAESYQEAKSMLEFAHRSKHTQGVFFVESYVFEYLFSLVPYDKRKHFLQDYKQRLEKSPELIDTIRSLIKNNMNILETSQDLYLHRNTVIYRIEKIKELLEINPYHDQEDRELLRIIELFIE